MGPNRTRVTVMISRGIDHHRDLSLLTEACLTRLHLLDEQCSSASDDELQFAELLCVHKDENANADVTLKYAYLI